MEWLSKNGVALLGHSITILVFLVGVVTVDRNLRLQRYKDIAVKQYDRSAESIERCTALFEVIRMKLWKLSIRPFDRNAPMDTGTEAALDEVELQRSTLFGLAIFLPPELVKAQKTVYACFDGFTPVITAPDVSMSAKEAANDRCRAAIGEWRELAAQWYVREWKRLQS